MPRTSAAHGLLHACRLTVTVRCIRRSSVTLTATKPTRSPTPGTPASFFPAPCFWLALWRGRGDDAAQLLAGNKEPLPLRFLPPPLKTQRPTTRRSGAPWPSWRCVRAPEDGSIVVKRLSSGALCRHAVWLRPVSPFPFSPLLWLGLGFGVS
jgi:hypothetical protein